MIKSVLLLLMVTQSLTSKSPSSETCTLHGHHCAPTYEYNNETQHHKCMPLVGDRTWCLLKPKLAPGEKLQLGVNYDECLTKCPSSEHALGTLNHVTALIGSAAAMLLFIVTSLFVVYQLFERQMFCFARSDEDNQDYTQKKMIKKLRREIKSSHGNRLQLDSLPQPRRHHKIKLIDSPSDEPFEPSEPL